MTQYPNEKDPRSDWVYPAQQPSHGGAPAPPQEYHPPPGPPPSYGYVQAHPDGQTAYARAIPGPSDTGPSSSSTQAQDDSQGMSLGSFFGSKGPPQMWQRPVEHQLPYNAFPPMCLISNGSDLSKGFPNLPPPCVLNPHPFATHDVTEEDWKRFLADVKKAGSLSPMQRIKSNAIPMVMGLGFISGFFATNRIEKKMKHNNRGATGDVVDHWNHYFFGPRRMEVVLCQASERLSGKLGAAPVGDPNQERMAHGLRQRGQGDSSEDSSEDERNNHHVLSDRQARRADKRERRSERRAKRDERRAKKARGDYEQPYQLFVTAV